MAHTTDLTDGFYVIHNGDFSGNVAILHQNDPKVNYEIPFDVIREIYLTKTRREMVSNIEQLTTDEFEEFLIEGC